MISELRRRFVHWLVHAPGKRASPSVFVTPIMQGCVGWLICRVIPEPYNQQTNDLFIGEGLPGLTPIAQCLTTAARSTMRGIPAESGSVP
jgi:hypothetical protein